MKVLRFVVAFTFIGFAIFTATSYAGDGTTPPTPVPTPAPPSTPPPKPLAAALDAVGAGGAMNKANIALYGYAEGGYFHDFSVPKNGGLTYIGFNNYKNHPELNKIDLTLERTVDQTKNQFDVGFHVEGLWGTDAPFIHSRGLLDNQSSGRYEWDLVQAYVDITTPGIPLRFRLGKWIALAGFEEFSANIYGAFGDPARALYSYSYQFLYAEPGTQTGVLATYVVNSKLSLDAGITRGWNQSLQSNGTADFLGRVTWTPTDKTSVTFVMTEGPEFPTGVGKGQPNADRSDSWTALNLVITQKINDSLSLGFCGDFVNAPHVPGFTGAQNWGGVAGYVSDAINPYLTFNGRVEWYHDGSGFSLGAPVGANYYEATAGVAIKPAPNNSILSNLLFRPELRYDTSDKRVFNNRDRNQLTFSMDALFTF